MGDTQPQLFSVRIVSIDYYMAKPVPGLDVSYTSLHGGQVNEVPVIRVYGSTPAGQKTCLHVHRALPYLYIPCSHLGQMTINEVDSCAHSISIALDKALKLKSSSGSQKQHVYGCEPVRAWKFYGYHASEALFLKIYLYYPQDVSRAANLLLAGALWDKILQPYESHIPFLLQFLIDYNLNGMGHLHVSKLKFRNPIPDSLFQRGAAQFSELGLIKNVFSQNLTDVGGDSCSGKLRWTSSSVPDGWVWEDGCQPDSRSTCELEGDAVADDIENQQSMSYTPLSQSRAGVKMVQSLLPIWEEENERNGAPYTFPPEFGRPLPQDVLRILSDELQCLDWLDSAESWSKLPPDSLISPIVDHELADKEASNHLSEKYVKASDRSRCLLSQELPFVNVDAAENFVLRADYKIEDSGFGGPSSTEAAEVDAMRLLKWLASSQAARDINSDEELDPETVFSPENSGFLNRANMESERESQKECQDILDSIDFPKPEELDAPAEFSDSSEAFLTKVIPQVDGACDDQPSTPSSNNSSLPDPVEPMPHEIDSGMIPEHRQKRPRWGCLPFSPQKAIDDVNSDMPSVPGGHYKEKEAAFDTFHEARRFTQASQGDAREGGRSKHDFAVAECSVRDLMRRKRLYRVQNSKYGSTKENEGDEGGNDKHDSEVEKALKSPGDSCNERSFGENSCQNSRTELLVMEVPAEDVEISECKAADISSNHDGYFESPIRQDQPNNVLLDAETGSVSMVFSEKPQGESEAPVFLGNEGRKVGATLLVDHLPFLSQNHFEEKGLSANGEEDGVTKSHQSSGSYSFMLRSALSPPSRESVETWLSLNVSDSSKKYKDASPTKKGSSADVSDSNSSSQDDPDSPSSEGKSYCIQAPVIKQEICSNITKPCDETCVKTSASSLPDASQVSGPDGKTKATPLSQIGFRDPASEGQGQQLTLLSIEVQAETRGNLRPDPRFDAITVVVLVCQEDDEAKRDALVLLRSPALPGKDVDAISKAKVLVFGEESQLLDYFRKVVSALDPDIIMGWDVQCASLGFLAERAVHLSIDLLHKISRCRSPTCEASVAMVKEPTAADSVQSQNAVIDDEWGRTHASGVHVGGRIVLNIWRLMRGEVKLGMYTVEAVTDSVLRRKIPNIPFRVLTKWFASGPGQARYRAVEYTLERAELNLQIMNQLDMINRTSELARVFGIDFFSVLSRGSQYRVESMLIRLAHTQNYLAISPGNQQVANQPAMECLPLVMEPESGFYSDPVVVLDFQSLYPSMVIAYNLCFCTCLGKMANSESEANVLGVCSYAPDSKLIRSMKHELLITPNGIAYAPSGVRKGILPRLLEEILSTRIMVKQAMKKIAPDQVVRHRILNARQLALKLIANVTYGYTAAGFSGRMPCAELADSIVQCGRRTLETAISFVNSHEKWGARVVYGDTDSMFVLLKGRSVEEAFKVGDEIASAVTEMNPSPIKLKMEKVYHPCFLLTKKRYVGYSFESPGQRKPAFDAKGIETVRRDSCGAVSKMMERSLRLYFESQDVDQVKAYLLRQWTRILCGRVSLEDFIFAKEVRLGTYSRRVHALPPAAIVATKAMSEDPRAEPRYAERVPYVVVHGKPGSRLSDMVVDPHELLATSSPLRLNDVYYITKQIIPALQRAFGVVGADLSRWFLDMPRPSREPVGKRHAPRMSQRRTRIDYYYASKHCLVCGELVARGESERLCGDCREDEASVCLALTGRACEAEKHIQHLNAICRHCGGGDWLVEGGVKCESLSCPVFFRRRSVQKQLRSLSELAAAYGFYPKCDVDLF